MWRAILLLHLQTLRFSPRLCLFDALHITANTDVTLQLAAPGRRASRASFLPPPKTLQRPPMPILKRRTLIEGQQSCSCSAAGVYRGACDLSWHRGRGHQNVSIGTLCLHLAVPC